MITPLTPERIRAIKSVSKLKDIVVTLTKNREKLISDFKEMKHKNKDLKIVNEELMKQLNEFKERSENEEKSNQDNSEELRQLREKIEIYEKELFYLRKRPLESDYKKLQQKNLIFQNQIQDLTAEKHKLIGQVSEETSILINTMRTLAERLRMEDNEINQVKLDSLDTKTAMKKMVNELKLVFQTLQNEYLNIISNNQIFAENQEKEKDELIRKIKEMENEIENERNKREQGISCINNQITHNKIELEQLLHFNEQQKEEYIKAIGNLENKSKSIIIKIDLAKSNFESTKLELTEKIRLLEEEYNAKSFKLKQFKEDSQKEIDVLNASIKMERGKVDLLEKELEKQKNIINELKQAENTLLKRGNESEIELFQIRDDFIQMLVKNIEILQLKADSLDSERWKRIAEQNKKILDLTTKLSKLNESNEVLGHKLNKMKEEFELNQNKLQNDIEEKLKQNKDLTNEINELNNQISCSKQIIIANNSQIEDISNNNDQKYEELKTEYLIITQQISLQEIEIQNLKNLNIKLDNINKLILAKKEALLQIYSDIPQKIEEAEQNFYHKFQNVMQKISNKTDLYFKNKFIFTDSIQQFIHQLLESRPQSKQLSSSNPSVVPETQDQIAKMKEMINKKKSECDENTITLEYSNEKYNKMIYKHKQKLKSLQEKNDHIKTLIVNTHRKISEEMESYTSNISKLEEEKTNLKNQYEKVKKELSDLKVKNNSEITQNQFEIIQLKARQQELSYQIKIEEVDHQHRISQIEDEIKLNENKIIEIQERYQQVVSTNSSQFSEKEKTNEEKNQRLNKLNQELQETLSKFNSEIELKNSNEIQLDDKIKLLQNKLNENILKYQLQISDKKRELNKKKMEIRTLEEKIALHYEQQILFEENKKSELNALNFRIESLQKEINSFDTNDATDVDHFTTKENGENSYGLEQKIVKKQQKVDNLTEKLERIRKSQKHDLLLTERQLQTLENEIKILKVAMERSKIDFNKKKEELIQEKKRKEVIMNNLHLQYKDLEKEQIIQLHKMVNLCDPNQQFLNPKMNSQQFVSPEVNNQNSPRFEETSLVSKINGIKQQIVWENKNHQKSIEKLNNKKDKKQAELANVVAEINQLRSKEKEEIQARMNQDIDLQNLDKKYLQDEEALLIKKVDLENQIRDIHTSISAENLNFKANKKQYKLMIENEKKQYHNLIKPIQEDKTIQQVNHSDVSYSNDLIEEEEDTYYSEDDFEYGNE